MNLRALLAFLRAYFRLGVVPDPNPEPDPNPGAGAGGSADPDPNPDADPLADLDLEEEVVEPGARGGAPSSGDPPNEAEQLRMEKDARARAEREAQELRRELARATPPPQQQMTEEARLYQQEEERLRASDVTELERWQINSNRTMRMSGRNATAALIEARELADRTEFSSICTANPIAKKYAKRVEEKYAEFYAKGQPVPRKVILRVLIGDDVMEGKVKAKKRAPAGGEGGGEAAGTRVARGTPASARSDVRARSGGQSERDKRRARLDGQII